MMFEFRLRMEFLDLDAGRRHVGRSTIFRPYVPMNGLYFENLLDGPDPAAIVEDARLMAYEVTDIDDDSGSVFIVQVDYALVEQPGAPEPTFEDLRDATGEPWIWHAEIIDRKSVV